MSPRLLFASGAVDDAGSKGLSIAEETRSCLALVEEALAHQGAGLPDLLKAVLYVTPGAHAEVWAAWDEAFAGSRARPMRLTQVAGLPPGARVAIDAVAQTTTTEGHPS